ncbi:MAG: NERD domain-containing protein [Kiritimatiellae bacterium]|nr:NERD domain-containing protein [Kiritimatiellia bacterium]
MNAIFCILLVPMLAICALFRFNPGAAGEWVLHLLLALKLDKKRFRVLRNVMLPTDDGTTTQIDHVVVNPEQVSEVADTILAWQATLTRERKAAHVANLRKNHPAKRP